MTTVGFGTGRLSEDEARQSIETALETGYRFFDTARQYGTECALGDAIEAVSVDRAEITIGTKVDSRELQYDAVRESAERSLEALGTDRLDVLYVHWPAHDFHPVQTFEAFRDLQSNGQIDAVGICNVTSDLLAETIDCAPIPIDFVQIEFHPYLDQRDLLDVANRHDIDVVAASPLADGRVFEDSTVQKIAEEEGLPVAQVILKWCIANGTTPIPCSAKPNHIRQNFGAATVQLSDKGRRRLDDLVIGLRVTDYEFAPWNR